MLALKKKKVHNFFFLIYLLLKMITSFLFDCSIQKHVFLFLRNKYTHKGERNKSNIKVHHNFIWIWVWISHTQYIYIYILFVCILSNGCKKRFSDVFYDVKWKHFLISQPNLPLCKTHRIGANPIGFTQKHIKLD